MLTSLIYKLQSCFAQASKSRKTYFFQTALKKQRKDGRDSLDRCFVSNNVLIMMDCGARCREFVQDSPSLFADGLIVIMRKLLINEPLRYILNPRKLVENALETEEGASLNGQSTITVITMHPDTGEIRTFYIGDSVYGIFREDEIQMVKEQSITLEVPQQIYSNSLDLDIGLADAFPWGHMMQEDILVLASDGLWDNMSPERIHYRVRGPLSHKNPQDKTEAYRELANLKKRYEQARDGLPLDPPIDRADLPLYDLENLAGYLVKEAYRMSKVKIYASPYFLKAQEYARKYNKKCLYPQTGRSDDITVVLARAVVRKNEQILY